MIAIDIIEKQTSISGAEDCLASPSFNFKVHHWNSNAIYNMIKCTCMLTDSSRAHTHTYTNETNPMLKTTITLSFQKIRLRSASLR